MLEDYLCVDDSCEDFAAHMSYLCTQNSVITNCKTLESPRNDIPFLVPRCDFRERAVWRLPVPSCPLLAQPPHQFVIMSSVALDERKGKKDCRSSRPFFPYTSVQSLLYTVLEYVIALSRECD